MQLEDPLLSELYHLLVNKGDWLATESLLEQTAYRERRVDSASKPYASNTLLMRSARFSPPDIHWTQTLKHSKEFAYRPPWPARSPPDPPARAAQATAYDPSKGVIYMHGGWDGMGSLSDFWAYDVRAREWTMISPDRTQVLMPRAAAGEGSKTLPDPTIRSSPWSESGPGQRRGHAMAFDDRSGMLYLYGRFYDPDPLAATLAAQMIPPTVFDTEDEHSRLSAGKQFDLIRMKTSSDSDCTGAKYQSDLWAFDTTNRRWVCLSTDVRAQGGPNLLYDHTMIVDSRRQQLYIFGGKEVKESSAVSHLDAMRLWTGVWCFDLVSNTWSCSRDDSRPFLLTKSAPLLGPPPGSGDGWDHTLSEQRPNDLWIIGESQSQYTNNIST